MKRVVIFLFALLLASAPAFAGNAVALKAGTFDPPRLAPDFSLAGSNGTPLKLSAYRGKVVLLGFGFSNCTAVCPVTLATLQQAYKKLGAQARDLQVIYITVDPRRDTVAQLKRYMTGFNPSFLGATGSEAQLAAVRRDYGIAAKQAPGPDGAYSHSSFIYLIDRQGRLRALMPFGHGADDYVHDVRLLLGAR